MPPKTTAKLEDKLGPDCKLLYTFIQNEFSRFRKEVNELFSKNDVNLTKFQNSVTELLTAKDKRIEELELKNLSLESELLAAQNKIDDQDQYSRKDSVILSGNAIKLMEDNENTHLLVKQLLKDNFDVEVSNADIS